MTKRITIQGLTFALAAVFSAGHKLTENEATALDGLRAENIRNNFSTTVKKAKEAAAEANGVDVKEVTADMLDTDALEAQLAEYAEGYQFGVRTGGRTTDPVERIARDIAKTTIENAIRAKGNKLSDYKAADINALVDKLLAGDNGEGIREQAEAQYKAAADIDIEV